MSIACLSTFVNEHSLQWQAVPSRSRRFGGSDALEVCCLIQVTSWKYTVHLSVGATVLKEGICKKLR